MRTCRLIYRSTARPDTLESENLAKLLQECASNNARLDVKGLLVVSGTRFLQVLEGSPRFVNEIFAAIMKDERHSEVELVSYEGTAKPHFYDWSMQVVDLSKVGEEFRPLFLKKYPNRKGIIDFPDDPFLVHSLLLDVKFVSS